MTSQNEAPEVIRAATSKETLISVVIPAHNAVRYLREAVQSVLESDFAALEVIVVDDGSTDGSLESLYPIRDARLTLLRQKASGGPSRPRNVGISRARAPYIALLDADDLIRPDKLSSAYSALHQCPSAVIAFGDYDRIGESGEIISESALADYPVLNGLTMHPLGGEAYLLSQDSFARALLHENFIGTSGTMIRRSALSTAGPFDEELTYSEDRDLWFRLAHLGDAILFRSTGHSYRVFSGSLTFRPGPMQARNRLVALSRERARWKDHGAIRQIDRLMAANHFALGYALRATRNNGASAREFLRAFRADRRMKYLRAAVGSLVSMIVH